MQPSRITPRESNIELLRIVAMSMIVSGHIFFHGLEHTVKNTSFYMGIESLFICGVNLFFLISGWFGIRFSYRSLLRLIATTFFFIAVNIGLLQLCGVHIGCQTYIDTIFFPVSRGHYWFIMVYVALLLMSPIINGGIDALRPRVFTIFMMLFTLFNVYSCSIGGNYVNQNGYTIVQAIWLYCVAKWLRTHSDITDKLSRKWLLAGFGFFSLCSSVGAVASSSFKWYYYNSPLVFLASVSLFLYFTRLKFQCRFINRLAAASLGCYFLQDGLFGHRYLYSFIERSYFAIVNTHPFVEAVSICAVLFLCVVAAYWLASSLLTPIANGFGTVLYSLAKRFKAKSRIAS